MFGWGFAKGFSGGRYSFTQAAIKAKAAGYQAASLELDAPDELEGWGTVGAFNTAHWGEFRAAFNAQGILAGSWFTEGANVRNTPFDADFTLAECEGPGDYDGILSAESHGVPPVPKAIVTNFNLPLTDSSRAPQPRAAKLLIDAGYFCLTESYLGDNPNATPGNLEAMARALGWPGKPHSQPVFGVYNAPPSVYAPWKDWPGTDYLGEYVL